MAEVTEVFEAIPVAAKTLHLFAGLGHESYVTARSDEWKKIVLDFMPPRR